VRAEAVEHGAMPPIHRTARTGALVGAEFGAGTPVAVGQVLALGITKAELRAAVRAGALVRVRHGVVLAPAGAPAASVNGRPPGDAPGNSSRVGSAPGAGVSRHPWSGGAGRLVDEDGLSTQHLADARAALLALADDSVVSHGSSALLQGLPTFGPAPSDVWVTAPRHGRIVTGTHRRLGEVPRADRVLLDGIPVTGMARTALDLARRRPLHQQLVALDAAAACVGPDELARAFARLSWKRDLIGVSLALHQANPLSESPLESISRGRMIQGQLPLPELQAWVQGEDGRWYRVDFLWRQHGVVGEADGLLKYRTEADLRSEKLREDALRARGLGVVRWTYDDAVRRPDRLLTRIQRALASQHTPLPPSRVSLPGV
jgi:very-short-patch-repair endonuclease